MPKISLFAILPPLVFAGLAGMFYVGMNREDPQALPSTLIGEIAPALTVSELPEAPLLTQEFLAATDVKLVNFWASWCVPCRAEHPQLEALAAAGITLHGVNYMDRPEAAARFLAELGNPFQTLGADTTGRTGRDWGVYGVPETFVLDGEGRVVLRFAGPITKAVLAEKIMPAVQAAQP